MRSLFRAIANLWREYNQFGRAVRCMTRRRTNDRGAAVSSACARVRCAVSRVRIKLRTPCCCRSTSNYGSRTRNFGQR